MKIYVQGNRSVRDNIRATKDISATLPLCQKLILYIFAEVPVLWLFRGTVFGRSLAFIKINKLSIHHSAGNPCDWC